MVSSILGFSSLSDVTLNFGDLESSEVLTKFYKKTGLLPKHVDLKIHVIAMLIFGAKHHMNPG